jgi:hypothetical protein
VLETEKEPCVTAQMELTTSMMLPFAQLVLKIVNSVPEEILVIVQFVLKDTEESHVVNTFQLPNQQPLKTYQLDQP